MSSTPASYREVIDANGRIYRVGESDRDLLGRSRASMVWLPWIAMMAVSVFEYGYGAAADTLRHAHGWSLSQTFWLLSVWAVFQAAVAYPAGRLREKGITSARSTMLAAAVLSAVGFVTVAHSSNLVVAFLGFAVCGGCGVGLVYSTGITIVGKWYPERRGAKTGFVCGGFAYGAVPFIFIFSYALHPNTYVWVLDLVGAFMLVVLVICGAYFQDPPKNWWPAEVNPLDWSKNKRTARDLQSNPPALGHYSLKTMWATPQAKWLGIQYALYIGCSLFGVAFYYSFGTAMHLGLWAAVGGAAGFNLADGAFRPVYGLISEHIGRRRTMAYAYSLNVVFQLATLAAGLNHQPALFAIFAVISGGLSGANFPMTAAAVADYYGENNNAINYGSVYAFKALGGSFAGGLAALIMTGTLYGAATFHWERGFFFGAALGAVAAVVVYFKCKAPTREQYERALAKTAPVTSRQGVSRAA